MEVQFSIQEQAAGDCGSEGTVCEGVNTFKSLVVDGDGEWGFDSTSLHMTVVFLMLKVRANSLQARASLSISTCSPDKVWYVSTASSAH